MLIRVFYAMLTKGVDYDRKMVIIVYLQHIHAKNVTPTDHSAGTGSVINNTKNEPVVGRNSK